MATAVAVEEGIALVAGRAIAAATAAASSFIGGGFSRPGLTAPSSTGDSPGYIGPGGFGAIDEWLRRKTQGGFRAHGGMDIVNSPTTFTAGEKGAEIAAFIPLSNNRNINHTFDKLPIDFGGLPGGVDTGQVESIVYAAMIELARVLGSTRR